MDVHRGAEGAHEKDALEGHARGREQMPKREHDRLHRAAVQRERPERRRRRLQHDQHRHLHTVSHARRPNCTLTFCTANTRSDTLICRTTSPSVIAGTDARCPSYSSALRALVHDCRTHGPSPNSSTSGRCTSLYARLRSLPSRSAVRASSGVQPTSGDDCMPANRPRRSGNSADRSESSSTPTLAEPPVSESRTRRCETSSDARATICMQSNGESSPNAPMPLKERTNRSDSCRQSRTTGSESVGMSSRRRCASCWYSTKKRADSCTMCSFEVLDAHGQQRADRSGAGTYAKESMTVSTARRSSSAASRRSRRDHEKHPDETSVWSCTRMD